MDISKIRSHNGSQQNGFEELVCQLAHLQENQHYDKFVRIEGAGGDGGIECYWKLKDGSIHGWQAKYFIGSFQVAQLNQLTKSVESALDNYPTLTKYYICLPRDRTPAQTTKLDEKIQEWKEIALGKKISIEFEYWGKHEISQMLQTDNPHFSGRLLYWFNEVVLTQDRLEEIANLSKQSLGERYTPEFHVDLPIVKIFDAIVGNDKFWNELKQRINDESKQFAKIENAFSRPHEIENIKSIPEEVLKNLKELQSISDDVVGKIKLFCDKKNILDVNGCLDFIQNKNTTYKNKHSETKEFINKDKKLEEHIYRIPPDLDEFEYILGNKNIEIEIARNNAVLLLGNAGVGKSHLLCDITLKRLENGNPTLFLLGQHYRGGNPLDFIKQSLDLTTQSNGQVLGALDALGEVNNCITLILIDAINEGCHREDWKNHVVNFISELKKYPHIAIVLSCRTTYKDYIVPDNSGLIDIYHHGFSGFEHRAMKQYLSKQGISEPNTPILSPEFSNPLFLKTCCKALKDSGQTNFPKGMHGMEELFNFYTDSIERVVSNKKHYRNGEKVVLNALKHFADKIYPDYVFGMPVSEARETITSKDTNPNTDEPLFDLLIYEGVLSEDINYSNQSPIIRFTYEKFSDYFIAKNLLSSIADKNISSIFKSRRFKDMVEPEKYYKTIGIMSMLGIQIAEKFNKELIDLIPAPQKDKDYQFNNMFNRLFENAFIDTLQWRSKNSFTNRTRELLNKIPKNIYNHSWEVLDILLKLSTEPNHPWNADFLHKSLTKKTMSERDSFWSIHIATNDYFENSERPESPLRSLVEWAHSANLDNAEKEQIRLCSIVLMWMTTTTNRKVRDQATKALARMLSIHPDLLLNLLKEFYRVNDAYVVERLYAVAYGVVVNINNKDIIYEVAKFVYDELFRDNQPTPNILIRDYGNSVLEFALYKNFLTDEFIVDNFRPPYKSNWKNKNISEQDIENLPNSRIKYSVVYGIKDFGNYTMSCVHDWSSSSIDEARAETAHELQLKFAKTLDNPLKNKLIKALNERHTEQVGFNIGNGKDTQKKFRQEIDNLNEEQKENYRWVMGLDIGWRGAAGFSRKFAQRWVCKRAYELGWHEELFEKFEKSDYVTCNNRITKKIERIGKKYQWIAFYELLAYLADNYYYIDREYSDEDRTQYYGPWQLYKRNIDPTHWLRITAKEKWDKWTEACWWQPFIYPFADTEDKINDWLKDRDKIPPFKKLLAVKDNEDIKWCVLSGFSVWQKEIVNLPIQDGWYRINPCIVPKKYVAKLKKHFKNKILKSPEIVNISRSIQGFLKEYPWHNSCKDMLNWDDNKIFDGLDISYLVPVVTYEWSKSDNDASLDESISIYTPSKKIIDGLGLSENLQRFGEWHNNDGNIVFKDPSIYEKGPSVALVRKDILLQWLRNNELQLIWLVGGEKNLFPSSYGDGEFYGRLNYSGLYELSDNGVIGNTWFNEEKK